MMVMCPYALCFSWNTEELLMTIKSIFPMDKILYCWFEVACKGSIMFKEESYVYLFLLLKNSFTPWKPDSLRDDTLILRITSLSSQHFLVHPQEFSLNPCHNDLCDYHSWTKNNSLFPFQESPQQEYYVYFLFLKI